MTKVLPKLNSDINRAYKSWEESIIAPKFTLKNFADELHYYLRYYLKTKKKFSELIFFLFLNAIQRIFYSIGTYLTKLKMAK